MGPSSAYRHVLPSTLWRSIPSAVEVSRCTAAGRASLWASPIPSTTARTAWKDEERPTDLSLMLTGPVDPQRQLTIGPRTSGKKSPSLRNSRWLTRPVRLSVYCIVNTACLSCGSLNAPTSMSKSCRHRLGAASVPWLGLSVPRSSRSQSLGRAASASAWQRERECASDRARVCQGARPRDRRTDAQPQNDDARC